MMDYLSKLDASIEAMMRPEDVAERRFGGDAKAASTGSFAIAWYDQRKKRARLIVGTPGEGGIKADTPYRVNDAGKLEEVTGGEW